MPSKPIHPGEILSDELEAINMSASALARAIYVPANRISQILSGKRNISTDTALRLGRFFGTGPQFWLNLQIAYELDLMSADGGPNLADIAPFPRASLQAGENRQGHPKS
ncbi:MAG: HigA family addiction module antidote protein [Synergistaceae bacterium]|jgi:addiction module HigA family antidote|nr:HigA family addiction module antidote protein [Synergistaceae bacterium]